MEGAVAAGHPQTAAAGARILAEGGNAVDACVAAAFAAAVCESSLTGLGAGGFMLVHRARTRSTRLVDFFAAAPGLGRTRRRGGTPLEIAVRFGDGATSQPFRIGPASVAVPGFLPGLEAAHRAYGRLPWRELVVPACELARDGVALTRAQAYLHAILDPILRAYPEGRRLYAGRAGAPLGRGETLRLPELAATLEAVGRHGAGVLARGERARALVAAVAAGGGEVTLADLAAYRPVWRRPVAVALGRHTLLSNPPPSPGGVLIAYALALQERLPRAAAGSARALALQVEVMREQERARGVGFARALHRGGLAAALLAPGSLAAARRRVLVGGPLAAAPQARSGTTHVSVIDGEGNAASLSTSTGSGSGVVVPGTGIYLNNMLGEDDLVGAGELRPGRRLTSMMAPTIVLAGTGTPRLVLGSAGSARLRGAIAQVASNVLAHGLGVAAAIDAPRVHAEADVVHCEGGHDPAALAALAAMGYELVRWRRRNLFFGGVAAVEVLADRSRAAAGDPRRGGAGLVVA